MPKVPRQPDLARLRGAEPDVHVLPRGAVLWRVYFRGGKHPTFWNEFRHVGPLDSRFDHHDGEEPDYQARSVLYAAGSPVTCLGEAFQKTRTIHRSALAGWLAGFELATDIELLDLMGGFATRAGASMGLMSGPRSVSRNWARGFYDAYPATQGLRYPSSMHANRTAVVLTDRAEAAGALPAQPGFHRALADPAILEILRNAAGELGYGLG